VAAPKRNRRGLLVIVGLPVNSPIQAEPRAIGSTTK
jgi:hypothetical protein